MSEEIPQISEQVQPMTEEQSVGGTAVQTEIPQINDETINVDDAKAFAEQNAETERQIAQQQEQDEKLLAALDKVLEKQNQQTSVQNPKYSKRKRVTDTVVKKGVGFISLGLILVFMGIVMITTLCSAYPNYTIPLKLSPICAIIIGAEMLITQLLTHERPRINIPSIAISVVLVVGCCILCAKLGGNYKEETVEHNNRTVAAEIYDKSYNELRNLAEIKSVNIDVNLSPDGAGTKKGMEALSTADIVNVRVEFDGIYNTPNAFAEDCKKIIDGYRLMGIGVTNFHFTNESKFRSYSLEVEGKYAQDFDAERLADEVNYVYVDDYDYIEDLEDYSETSQTTSDDTVSE